MVICDKATKAHGLVLTSKIVRAWRKRAQSCRYRWRDSMRDPDFQGHWMCRYNGGMARCMARSCPCVVEVLAGGEK